MGKISNIIKKFDIDDIKYIAKLFKRYKVGIGVLIATQIPLAAATVGISFLFKNILDAITGRYKGDISVMVVLAVVVIVTQSLVQIFTSKFSIKTSTSIMNMMQQELYTHMQKMEYCHLNNQHSSKWMTLMTSDIGNISGVMTDVVPKLASSLAVCIGAGISIIILFPMSAFLAILIVPFVILYNKFYTTKQKAMQTEAQEKDSKVRAFMQDSIGIINVIKAFGNYQIWLDNFEKLQAQKTEIIMKRNNMSLIIGNISAISTQLLLIFMLFFGAGMVKNGDLTFGTLIAIIQMISMLTNSSKGVMSSSGRIINCLSSAHRLSDAMGLSEEEISDINRLKNPVGIIFKDVSFSYDNIRAVLKNVSFEIPAGKMIGIIGESGIGKSTIANLIVGLYNVQEGEVYFKNVDGSLEASSSTRNMVSYVPQGNSLVTGSIRDNLLIGNPNATDGQMENALEMAGLMELVNSLKDRMNTVVGEKGTLLSAGQAQRICIARALLKDAPILLLDEPSSCLDPETEMSVLTTIKNKMPNITRVIITHRHEALKLCDRTIIVGNGVVKSD